MPTSNQMPLTNPSASPIPAIAQTAVSFDEVTHSMVLTFSRIKTVKYVLKYDVPLQETGTSASLATRSAQVAEPVTQALVGEGAADNRNTFTVSHLLGTQSADQIIKHTFTTGVLEAEVLNSSGTIEHIAKTVTLDAHKKIILSDVVATDAAHLATPSALLTSTPVLPRALPAEVTAPLVAVATPARSGSVLGVSSTLFSPIWLIGAGITLMAVVVGIYWRRRIVNVEFKTDQSVPMTRRPSTPEPIQPF